MIIQEITDRQITTVETDVWSGGLGALNLIFNVVLPILLTVFIIYIFYKSFKILKRMNNTLDEINKKIQDPNSSS